MGITKDYVRFVHAGRCNIVCSQNGTVQSVDKVTCAVSAGEAVSLFNMRTLEKTAEIRRDAKEVTTFLFNNDQSFLAIGYIDGEIHVYRREGKDYAGPITFSGHRSGVNCLAFSNDGFILASGGKDSVVILWDIVNELGMFRMTEHRGSITCMKFTMDGKYLLTSSKDTNIKFWDVNAQCCFYTLTNQLSEIYTFSLIKSDRLLIIGGSSAEMDVYELLWEIGNNLPASGMPIQAKKRKNPLISSDIFKNEMGQGNDIVLCKKRGILMRNTAGRTLQLAVSSDESVMFAVGSDRSVDIFRIFADEESRDRLKRKIHRAKKAVASTGEQVNELEIGLDISIIASRIGQFALDAKIKCLDIYSQVTRCATSKQYRIYCLLRSNTVHGVLVTLETKANTIDGESVRGHRSLVKAISVSSNQMSFLSGSAESAILWDLQTLLPVNTFSTENITDITSTAFIPGDKQVVLATKAGTIAIVDIPTNDVIEIIKLAHEKSITAICMLPQKDGFVTSGSDKRAIIWKYILIPDIDKKRLSVQKVQTIDLPDEILCSTISSDGKFIAFGLLDNTARVYFLEKMKYFVTLYGHSLPIHCMDISKNGKLIATGSADKSLRIWGLDFGDCHRSIFAHNGVVTSVKFAVDLEEDLVWTAGKDGLIKQWSAKSFSLIQTLKGHFGEIAALEVYADGRTLLSASNDRSIRVWEKTDEIIVLDEERAQEREEEDLDNIIDAEDMIPGETPESDVGLASKKSITSVKGAESVLEAVEIFRNESIAIGEDPKHKKHALIEAYGSENLSQFVLDAIGRLSSGDLERSLMLIPYDYVIDILDCISNCVDAQYRMELAYRVVNFLLRINLNRLTAQRDRISFLKKVDGILRTEISSSLSTVNFNLSALRLHRLSIEEREKVQLFKSVYGTSKTKAKRKKKAVVNPTIV